MPVKRVPGGYRLIPVRKGQDPRRRKKEYRRPEEEALLIDGGHGDGPEYETQSQTDPPALGKVDPGWVDAHALDPGAVHITPGGHGIMDAGGGFEIQVIPSEDDPDAIQETIVGGAITPTSVRPSLIGSKARSVALPARKAAAARAAAAARPAPRPSPKKP